MTAKVRIEYVRAAQGTDSLTIQQILGGAQTLTINASSVQSAAAPAFPSVGSRTGLTFARLSCVQGAAVVVGPSANPIATEAAGTRLDINSEPLMIAVATGDKLAFLEAADAPASIGGGGGGGGSSLGAVATAAAPTYTEGATVAQSTDLTGNTRVIDLNIGAKADAAATTDTGSFSLIALFKRLLQGITSLVTAATDTSDVNIKGPPTAIVQVVPATTAATFTTGQVVGGKLTFAAMARSGLAAPILSGILYDAVIGAKTATPFDFDLFLFNADPTGSTLTNAAAFALVAADMPKVIDVIQFKAASDWFAGNPVAIGAKRGLATPYLTTAGNIYAAIVARQSVTLVSTTDLILTLKGSPD